MFSCGRVKGRWELSWIKSNPELLAHPKLLRLSLTMGWSVDETVGKLHRLWWWCLTYALDGRLDKFIPQEITHAMGVDSSMAEPLLKALINSGFLEDNPLKIHDWMDYAGEFIKARQRVQKFRAKRVTGMKRINPISETAKSRVEKSRVEKSRVEKSRVEKSRVEKSREEENKPLNPLSGVGCNFETFWKAYPRKVGKRAAE